MGTFALRMRGIALLFYSYRRIDFGWPLIEINFVCKRIYLFHRNANKIIFFLFLPTIDTLIKRKQYNLSAYLFNIIEKLETQRMLT